jgi:transposase
MGTRETDQSPLWIAVSDLPASPGHPFYARLNAVLDAHGFDRFAEDQCREFYAKVMGRPSLPPGQYFRLLLVGYFEGIDAERGIAWRAADSLAVRRFVRLALHEAAPDHTTISRTRRLIAVETHRAVFTWVQQRLVEVGLLKGKTLAIDATTLEANAAMRSIVRRDTAEPYQEFLTRLAKASGIETPTREDLARLDRKRKKKTSNTEWTHPHDPDAKVTTMKDSRTHLAHKAEHAVDLETGAIVAVTVQPADDGDTTTIVDTVLAALEQVAAAQAGGAARGRAHHRQGVPQQSDPGRTRRPGPPLVHRGARPWATPLVEGAGGPSAGVWQSPTDSRPTGTAPDAATRRVCRTRVRAPLRYRRDASHASPWSHQYPETRLDPCGRLQSWARHASIDWTRDAARSTGPAGGGPRPRHRALDARRRVRE